MFFDKFEHLPKFGSALTNFVLLIVLRKTRKICSRYYGLVEEWDIKNRNNSKCFNNKIPCLKPLVEKVQIERLITLNH